MATKLQTTKAKINKCGYNKLKSFCTAQKQQNEEANLEWENICANHVSDKGLTSKIS